MHAFFVTMVNVFTVIDTSLLCLKGNSHPCFPHTKQLNVEQFTYSKTLSLLQSHKVRKDTKPYCTVFTMLRTLQMCCLLLLLLLVLKEGFLVEPGIVFKAAIVQVL